MFCGREGTPGAHLLECPVMMDAVRRTTTSTIATTGQQDNIHKNNNNINNEDRNEHGRKQDLVYGPQSVNKFLFTGPRA